MGILTQIKLNYNTYESTNDQSRDALKAAFQLPLNIIISCCKPLTNDVRYQTSLFNPTFKFFESLINDIIISPPIVAFNQSSNRCMETLIELRNILISNIPPPQ